MSRKAKFSNEEKKTAVQEYFDNKGSLKTISQKYGISLPTFEWLVLRAKSNGIDSIVSTNKNACYSKETKINAVKDYLSGKGSLRKICLKYEIRTDSLLRKWIKCYNGNNDFNERTRSERGITMNKGRKTTREERAEIVAYCIEKGKDYGLTMEKYNVSYQQIYSWVRKYEEKGVEGLSDRRGKAKPENELTEADRLRMENKILQAKIKDMEMENALLKKIRELEGWRY